MVTDEKQAWLDQTVSPLTLEPDGEDGIRISWNIEDDPLNFCVINRAQAEALIADLKEKTAALTA